MAGEGRRTKAWAAGEMEVSEALTAKALEVLEGLEEQARVVSWRMAHCICSRPRFCI